MLPTIHHRSQSSHRTQVVHSGNTILPPYNGTKDTKQGNTLSCLEGRLTVGLITYASTSTAQWQTQWHHLRLTTTYTEASFLLKGSYVAAHTPQPLRCYIPFTIDCDSNSCLENYSNTPTRHTSQSGSFNILLLFHNKNVFSLPTFFLYD